MISFDLRCGNDHIFEAWFGSSADFDDQHKRGLVSCPICDDVNVGKAVMAPAVGAKGNSEGAVRAARERLQHVMAWQRQLEAQSDHVGRRFVAEARARHALPEDERPQRGLIGEATLEEAAELIDDGIPVAPLPLPLRRNAQA